MPKVQIVIPCINLWNKYTKDCIASIKTKYDHRILLIDNGSTDETKVEAGKLVNDKFAHHRNEDSWSCARSWNFGVRDGFDRGFEYILVINNDVLLHPDAIDLLVERFEGSKKHGESDKPLAMVTCNDVRGECPTPASIFTRSVMDKETVSEAEHPCFSGFMINRECWDKIGEFDEDFKPAYFEDNDYHYRINMSGMKAIVLPTSMFYHFGSATKNESGTNIITNHSFELNRMYYQRKWGGLPGQEKFTVEFDGK